MNILCACCWWPVVKYGFQLHFMWRLFHLKGQIFDQSKKNTWIFCSKLKKNTLYGGSLGYLGTVAPRYNEPHYNKDPIITNNIWKSGRITVKYGETNLTNPAITNWFWLSQCTVYPAITNILSCRSQSIKTTWWYKWLISQTQLLLVKIGKLWPSKLCFIYM